jgi:hypothetical protein
LQLFGYSKDKQELIKFGEAQSGEHTEETSEITEKAVAATTATEGNLAVFRSDFGIEGKVAKSVTASYCKKMKDEALPLFLQMQMQTPTDSWSSPLASRIVPSLPYHV